MKSGGTSEEVDEEEEEEGGGSYEMKGEKRLLAHVHATPSHVYGFFFFSSSFSPCARRDYNCSSRYPTWINVSSPYLPSTYLSCGALGYMHHSVVQLRGKGGGEGGRGGGGGRRGKERRQRRNQTSIPSE